MPDILASLRRVRSEEQDPIMASLERIRSGTINLATTPGAVPTEQIEGITGPLPGGGLEDPGLGGILQSTAAEFIGAPLAKLQEFTGTRFQEGYRLRIREDFERKRVAFLASDPKLSSSGFGVSRSPLGGAVHLRGVRPWIVAVSEFAANLVPLLPGGFLGSQAARGAARLGASPAVARTLGFGVAGAAEGGLIGAADAPLVPENQRALSIGLAAGGAALLGGGVARFGSRASSAIVSDTVSETFGRKYVVEEAPVEKVMDRLKALGRRLLVEMDDEFAPITSVAKKGGLPANERVQELLQQVRAAPLQSQAPVFVETRLYDPAARDIVRTGESMKDYLDELVPNVEVYRDAGRYLLARRHVSDLVPRGTSRGGKLKIDPEATQDAQGLIDHFIGKYGVDEATSRINVLDDIAERHSAWETRSVLMPLQNAGFLSEEAVGRITTDNANYALFSRPGNRKTVLEVELEKAGFTASELAAGETPGAAGRGNPLKRITGGLSKDAPVDDVFEASAARAMRVQRLVDKQHVRNFIGDMAAGIPEVAAEIKVKPGKSLLRRTDDGSTEFLTRVDPQGGFAVWRDGKKTILDGTPELVRAMDGLTSKELGILSGFLPGILKVATRVLRVGATSNPAFFFKNPGRDSITGGIHSKYGLIPIWDPAAVLVEQLWSRATRGRNSPIWDRVVNSGAASATFVALDKASLKASLARTKRLRAGPLEEFTKSTLSNPLHPLQVISDTLEKITRVAEGRLVAEGGRKRVLGLPVPGTRGSGPKGTTLEIGRAGAEVTLNFSKAGRVARQWNQIEAFANAELRDGFKMARAMKDRPLETTVKAFAFITAPALAEWAMHHEDPDWRALRDWEKALFFHIKKREDGSFYRTPKPLGILGLAFGTVVQQALSYMVDEDPNALPAILDAISEQSPLHYIYQPGEFIGTDLVPTALDPLVEMATNRSLFFGSDIESASMTRVDPSERFRDSTGPTARALARGAEALSVPKLDSPVMVEHLVNSTMAGTGRLGLNLSDAVARGTGLSGQPEPLTEGFPQRILGVRNPFISRTPFGPGSRAVSDFYDAAEESAQSWATARKIGKEGRRDEAREYLLARPNLELRSKMLSGLRKTLSDLRSLREEVAQASNLDDAEKAEKILQIDQAMTTQAAYALDVARQMEASS